MRFFVTAFQINWGLINAIIKRGGLNCAISVTPFLMNSGLIRKIIKEGSDIGNSHQPLVNEPGINQLNN